MVPRGRDGMHSTIDTTPRRDKKEREYDLTAREAAEFVSFDVEYLEGARAAAATVVVTMIRLAAALGTTELRPVGAANLSEAALIPSAITFNWIIIFERKNIERANNRFRKNCARNIWQMSRFEKQKLQASHSYFSQLK
ncbi:hypothetical protein ALC57_14351 [Trachymyrmex cornetzi]|uniref:Uncharacterized protein n=1 Tax=Trachymyrmex cornetzi TaxID=471704 RepID=A0A195DKC0_9HYME|nr:hypothetical protein ALC57_14351 [Trachymyrmex cornetzi]